MFRQWLGAHRSLAVTATSGSVIAALVATVAIVSSGYTAQRLDLNDGSVWVANGQSQAIGRANTQVFELNTVVANTGSDIDVVQRGATVLLVDHSESKVDIVDPATSKVLDSVPLPPQDPRVFLAGSNVVIASLGTGQFWIMPIGQLASFDAESQPTLSLGGNAVASITPNGELFVYSAEAHRVYRVDAARSEVVDHTDTVAGDLGSDVGLSSVDGTWALLDPARRIVHTAGGTVDLSSVIGEDQKPVLQQAADGAGQLLVGFSSGLMQVPLDGGKAERLVTGRSGTAAAPIVADGCLLAAWSGGSAWRRCGTEQATMLSLDSVPVTATRLGFVSNGDRVVLSDPHGGAAWAVQQNGELIDNWSDLITTRTDEQKVEENDASTPPDYEKTQLPPVAVDDSFGARPGRTSPMPVLLNDYDPNGDVLVISDVTPIDKNVGRLDIVSGDQQVQLTLAAGASGSISFGYTINDGRGGTASATVTVTVRLPSENSPPQQVRQSTALVAQGGRVTTSVVGDWVDPDGDPFYLASASTTAPDTASYRPEGTVVFTESGGTGSQRSVALVMSDGRDQGTGSLAVTVQPSGKVLIDPAPFLVPAYAGEAITVSPLDHVRGGTGPLRLVSVPAKNGVTITANLEAGTFQFVSDQVGTYYLEYVVTDGDQTATGSIRVDVAAPPDANTPPITIPQTVFVTPLGTRTLDVASTDIDPAGGVLLVTGVDTVPPDSGVRAEVVEQRSIMVTLTAPLSGPVAFDYRISNGLAEAEGVVTVVEISAPTRMQPPVANDDSVTVRVGDAIDIPVLDNDTQADGEELTLNPLLSTGLHGDSGLLFASGTVLRYLAPQKPGDFTAVYEVSAPDGQVAQARVTIAVREPVAATNNPPVAKTVVARVLAGQKVRIGIPLTGIDPDGDSVQFLGQATNPEKGTVVDVGADYLDFQAGDYSAGTDSFTYTVIDSLGAKATGLIRVGISPRLDGARNPVAVADEVTIRPGGTVSVQVLANDSDPDGSALTVTKVEPNSKDIVATIDGDIVKVTPPKATGRYGLVYTIQNAFGGTSSSFVTVVVSPTAPRAYPVVSDTVLTLTDILGRQTVDVDVLKNVFFADGEVNTLKVSLLPGYAEDASVTASKRVRVTIADKSQIIPFAVTHPDDSSIVSYAFIWVPGLDDALPQLNRRAAALTVPSESTLTIDLDDYVVAVGGKSVRLTDSASVQAAHSNGADLVVNDHTLRFTSADKYFGPASISFEVTDGTSGNDPNGHVATLVLPITVTPRENQPPLFVGGLIDFEPGESKEIDLVKLTSYPYPKDLDELVYSVLGTPPTGFSYTLTGQKLTLRADEDAQKNTTTSMLVGVKDALANGQAGRIQLSVVASSRPLASPAPDSVVAPRGKTTTVDVLANDEATNPFPGKPLRVLAIRGLGGDSVPDGLTISPSSDNRRLTVSASSSAEPGNTTLQYEVADATGDPDRYVWGSVTVSVQDVPDPVTGVTATSFGDRTITLRWNPGASNNAPITGYVVSLYSTSMDLLSKTPCAITVCDVTTPGNGPNNAVRVRVTATNAIGDSAPTGLDQAIWSDIVPPAPDGLTTAPLDGGLTITWDRVTAPSGASPVSSYHVTAGSASVDVDPSRCSGGTCSTQVSGLANGQTVAVAVSARNGSYGPLTTWKSSTTTGIPAGRPRVVGNPSAAATDSSIQASWNGVFDDNGRPITGYLAVAFTGTAPDCSGVSEDDASMATSKTFTGLSSESDYSVVVFAWNEIGCRASAAVAAHTSPGVVTAVSATGPEQHGGSATYDFTLTGASIGGTTLSGDYSYLYRIVSGGAATDQRAAVSAGAALMPDSKQYGTDVSLEVRACRTYPDAGTICQANWSAAFHLGTPVDPQVGTVAFAADSDGIGGVFSWVWPSSFAGYESLQYSCSGAPFVDAAAKDQSGSCHVATLLSPTLTIRVTANGGRAYTVTYDQGGRVQ
ncbi:MAG TPA: Ig-like domain-containing protein [Lacisediminihabitans sp.]|uniref:Ig-like domain-containing protein n=1 Tax=Lacisediminihabitans sp. TaxID=2787631 RepID=UPI002EDAF341